MTDHNTPDAAFDPVAGILARVTGIEGTVAQLLAQALATNAWLERLVKHHEAQAATPAAPAAMPAFPFPFAPPQQPAGQPAQVPTQQLQFDRSMPDGSGVIQAGRLRLPNGEGTLIYHRKANGTFSLVVESPDGLTRTTYVPEP